MERSLDQVANFGEKNCAEKMIGISLANFHHLGYAVNSLEEASRRLERLGWESGNIFEDKNQGIRGKFMKGGGPRIELLENLSNSSVLDPFLRSGNFVFYHMAYFTNDIEHSIPKSRRLGGKLVHPPMPAVAFGGRNICFLTFNAGMLIEWIEREVK